MISHILFNQNCINNNNNNNNKKNKKPKTKNYTKIL